MEVRIGVQNVARELSFETDDSVESITKAVEAALSKGEVLALKDDKGRHYIVPGAVLGYVHIGETEKGRVGFGS